jgi:hypothetical protein
LGGDGRLAVVTLDDGLGGDQFAAHGLIAEHVPLAEDELVAAAFGHETLDDEVRIAEGSAGDLAKRWEHGVLRERARPTEGALLDPGNALDAGAQARGEGGVTARAEPDIGEAIAVADETGLADIAEAAVDGVGMRRMKDQ